RRAARRAPRPDRRRAWHGLRRLSSHRVHARGAARRAERVVLLGEAARARNRARRATGAALVTSAPLPKFVIHSGTLWHELRKQRGTSNSMIPVPLFDFKFLHELAATAVGT